MVNDLYPFRGHYLDRGDLRYHYLDEGHGEPVVMVHGNPTWSFYYRNLILGLRDRYRCIAPDHIGCGKSDKPGDDRYHYTLAERANDVGALLDHLQVTRDINLVVHDWGGAIGMAYAVRHPERIKRLIILNTAAFHMPAGKTLPWQIRLIRNTVFGAWLVCGMNAFSRGANQLCSVKGISPEIQRAYLQPYNHWQNRRGVLRFVQDIPLEPSDPAYAPLSVIEQRLPRLARVPMLICWGARDFVFDDDYLHEWQRRFPRAEVHRFEDAGHYVLEDKPREIGQLVRRFLQTNTN